MPSAPDTIEPYLLTMRDWQCAHLYVQGCNNSEIARRLRCSPGLVVSMLERPGVKAHITEASIELMERERMTEEWLYSNAKRIIESAMSTATEKVAAMRLVSRWKGMEIERTEVTVYEGAAEELERARRRVLAKTSDAPQNALPTRLPNGGLT